jgi:hypothetical protein
MAETHEAADTRQWNIPRRAAAAGALAALAVVVFAGAELASHNSGPDRIYGSTVGHAQLHVNGGHAQLVARNLPYLPPGRVYEVWLQRGTGAPAPARAFFRVTKVGDGHVEVPGNLNGVTTVTVTAEPAGGSHIPTSRPVIVTRLT